MTGADLRAWRERHGMTQVQLAAAIGVPQATVSRWESGTHPIRHGTMLRLALERLEQRQQERTT